MSVRTSFIIGVVSIGTFACSSSSTPAAAPVQDASVGTHNIGESCGGAGDCIPGLLCDSSDPHGQCYKECSPSKDSDCGDTTKYACNFEGHCYQRCSATTDCARASEGYICKDDEPARPPVKFCDGPL